jgi:hypothetical protein
VDRRQNELEEHKRRRLGILSVELRWDGSHDRTAESRRRSAVPRHYRLPGARVQWATRRVAESWDLRVEGPNGFERSYALSAGRR